MRTTVDIPDAMYRQLKAKAASRGCSVKELVLKGVEKELNTTQRKKKRVNPPLVRSKLPGKLRITGKQIYEIIPLP